MFLRYFPTWNRHILFSLVFKPAMDKQTTVSADVFVPFGNTSCRQVPQQCSFGIIFPAIILDLSSFRAHGGVFAVYAAMILAWSPWWNIALELSLPSIFSINILYFVAIKRLLHFHLSNNV